MTEEEAQRIISPQYVLKGTGLVIWLTKGSESLVAPGSAPHKFNKGDEMNEISVSITKRNLNKIIHYAQAAYDEHKAEIGGMAVCVKGEDNEWTIEDPIILKQDITATNCALDKEELSSYYLDVNNNKKYKKKDWRFLWWHSHHMMDSFWSGTDLNAIDEFNE